tara:strand:- start:317 stop:520 length:204 start_codon:yes stop_codon:yes gene_type:complete
MDDLIFDCESLKEIVGILQEKERQDLLDYIQYLCETLLTIDDHIDEDDLVEEEYDVGKTEDGFYYLK